MTYTDEEIIKALECCANYEKQEDCIGCPIRSECNQNVLEKYALDLITRKKAEIERLKGWENLLKAESHAPIKAKARAEAIKEFAERVRMAFYYEFDELIPSIMSDKIDEIVKEMTEDKNG